MTETIPTEKLVKVYIRMRDKRAELKADYETQDRAIKDQMEAIEQELLELCKTAGANSIRTPAGTIIRRTDTRYWTSDWESMHAFILEQQRPDILERRISQAAMREFIEQHPDQIPKGLNADAKYTVTIRRA